MGQQGARPARPTTTKLTHRLPRPLRRRGSVDASDSRDFGSVPAPSDSTAMCLTVNRQGHPKTLVAAQHGNKNAVKTGIFSADLVASRIEEAERALAPLEAKELISDVLRTEIARFIVLRDAMDQDLDEGGLRGRGGQPRNMLSLRLRLNTRLLKTLEQFESRAAAGPEGLDRPLDPDQHDLRRSDLLEEIAGRQHRESPNLIAPAEFDPAEFLATIIESDDPTVSVDEQIRARTMLTRWRAGRATLCACFSTRAARDAAEFRGWIDELREAGLTQIEGDRSLAECVRSLARGERLEPRILYAKTSTALEAVVRAGVERAVPSPLDGSQPKTEMTDALDARLWRTMLSAEVRISVRQRLKAFDSLDKADGFRRCTCGGSQPKFRLAEEKVDSTRAYMIRLVGGRHYRAAAAVVQVPETYLAVSDAIDAAVRSQRDTTE